MKTIWHRFLSKILIAIFAGCVAFGGNAYADFNLPEISIENQWATAENLATIHDTIKGDTRVFSSKAQLADDFVPIEAKIGLAFMNSLSYVADSLQRSLMPFIFAFILIMFGFWAGFEIYNSIQGDNDVKKLVTSLVKKGGIVAIWLMILVFGPIELFSIIIAPIISIGTFLADTILDAGTAFAGIKLPDTCSAIHEYAQANTNANNILNPDMAATLLCIPTRLSGFCYTMIAAGWELIAGESQGAWNAVVDTCAGIAFIWLFISIAWKFAFSALGVVLDLFLGIIMLPFTALAETVGTTSLKAIPGQVYNAFTGVFKPEKLSDQINRLVNASVYYVSLSIVIGFCTALVGSVFVETTNTGSIDLKSPGFWISIIVGLLVWYFASKATEIAKDIGGSVNVSMGTTMNNDANKMMSNIWNLKPIATARNWSARQIAQGTKATVYGAGKLIGKGAKGIWGWFRR